MLQSKQRLLQLNAKLAETLTSKGVTATADETTTALVNKVADIPSGDSVLRGLIQRDLTDLIIPYGTVLIGDNAFTNYTSLMSVDIPNTVEIIGNSAFHTCSNLKKVDLSKTKIVRLSSSTFRNCWNLKEIILPEKVNNLGTYTFYDCVKLKTIHIPGTVNGMGANIFTGCNNLEFVTLGDGFNANNLYLSASTLYTRETILQWLNALADRTGQTAYKLTIGATNLAKLTEQDILIATNKNWTLA